MVLFVINGSVFVSIGIAFVTWPTKVLGMTARLSLAWYPKESPFYRIFDRTPFGAIQKQMVGLNSREFMEQAIENPGRFPAMLWWIRILGGFALFFGAPLLIIGWYAILTGD